MDKGEKGPEEGCLEAQREPSYDGQQASKEQRGVCQMVSKQGKS